MKKFIILVLLLFSFSLILHANPSYYYVISELYFDDNGDWCLELYDYEGGSPGNLDYCYLESSSSFAYFNEGIYFGSYDTLVVTNTDMQTDFTINREGDYLYVLGGFADEIFWGNFSSRINAPYPGQSLARVPYDDYFLVAKENQPTLGYNPFNVQTLGSLDGTVTYNNGVPVCGAVVSLYPIYYNVLTDEYGYFNISGIYGMNYNLTVTVNDSIIVDTTVTIEPEGTTYIELISDLGIDPHPHQKAITISNSPNPFYDETHIHFSLLNQYRERSISIFNSKGQKIKEIPVSPTETSITWSGHDKRNKLVPSGVYYYKLESEDKTLASGKMLYLR